MNADLHSRLTTAREQLRNLNRTLIELAESADLSGFTVVVDDLSDVSLALNDAADKLEDAVEHIAD